MKMTGSTEYGDAEKQLGSTLGIQSSPDTWIEKLINEFRMPSAFAKTTADPKRLYLSLSATVRVIAQQIPAEINSQREEIAKAYIANTTFNSGLKPEALPHLFLPCQEQYREDFENNLRLSDPMELLDYLHQAIYFKNEAAVRHLVEHHGVSPGVWCLTLAVKVKSPSLINYFLEKDSPIMLGMSLIDEIITSEDLDFVQTVLSALAAKKTFVVNLGGLVKWKQEENALAAIKYIVEDLKIPCYLSSFQLGEFSLKIPDRIFEYLVEKGIVPAKYQDDNTGEYDSDYDLDADESFPDLNSLLSAILSNSPDLFAQQVPVLGFEGIDPSYLVRLSLNCGSLKIIPKLSEMGVDVLAAMNDLEVSKLPIMSLPYLERLSSFAQKLSSKWSKNLAYRNMCLAKLLKSLGDADHEFSLCEDDFFNSGGMFEYETPIMMYPAFYGAMIEHRFGSGNVFEMAVESFVAYNENGAEFDAEIVEYVLRSDPELQLDEQVQQLVLKMALKNYAIGLVNHMLVDRKVKPSAENIELAAEIDANPEEATNSNLGAAYLSHSLHEMLTESLSLDLKQ